VLRHEILHALEIDQGNLAHAPTWMGVLKNVVWIKICDDIPISPDVIDVHTLDFKPNFKFSRLKFFGGTPVSVVVCAR